MNAAIPQTIRRSRCAIALLLVLAGGLSAAPAANAEREFTPRFSTAAPGGIAFASNTLMTCNEPAEGARCVTARDDRSNGSGTADSNLNNNNHAMVFVDVDSDPSTANSSSSRLVLPAGATVLFAGLYWSVSATPGAPPANWREVKLRGPADPAYLPTISGSCDSAPSADYGYSCFKDVTSTVQAEGAGSWMVGGAFGYQASGKGGGWTLVVAYQAPNMALRDLTVFDGQRIVSSTSTDPISIPVSGFTTPATGSVKSEVGLISFEGDRGIKGDYAQLDNTILADALHPTNNFFNSWISTLGANTPGRNPGYTNTLGYDATIVNADGILGNGASSAVIRVKTSGEAYMPFVATFSTELYAPNVQILKSVELIKAPGAPGSQARPGDTLKYTINLENKGLDGAAASVLSETQMPAGTEYVANSLTYDGTPVTDSPGDDRGEAAGGTGPLAVRLGSGVTATTGGLIAPAEKHTVTFEVKVTTLPPDGGLIRNIADLDYAGQTLGTSVDTVSPPADVTVRVPDASIKKTISSNTQNNMPAQYTIAVKNMGSAPTEGSLHVVDRLQKEFTSPTIDSASGWSCTITADPEPDPLKPNYATSVLDCTYSAPLAYGISAPPIIVATASLSKPGGTVITNTATVDTPFDGDPANNSSTATADVGAGVTAIPVAISPSAVAVLPGGQVSITGEYTNTGPSVATSPELTLEINSLAQTDIRALSFSVVASDGSVVKAKCSLTQSDSQPAKVVCNPTSLNPNVTVRIVMTVTPVAGITADSFDVKATSSAGNDPGAPRSATTTIEILPTADLSVTKSVSSATVEQGDPVTWTVEVTNKGPKTAKLINVSDSLPTDISPVSASWSNSSGGGTSGTCSTVGQTVQCAAGDLPAGTTDKVTVTILSTAGAAANGPRVNQAQAFSSLIADPDLSDNVAEAKVTILPSADLQLTKTGPTSLAPGKIGEFTLTAWNLGPSPAADTQIVDTLPDGLELAGPLPADCSFTAAAPPAVPSAKVTCSRGTLAVGDPRVKITLRLRVKSSVAAGTQLTNRGDATTSTPDPTPASASDAVVILVAHAASAKLGVGISAPRSARPLGSAVPILVRVSAPAGLSANSVKACVKLPSNVTWLRSTGVRRGSVVCWNIGTLAAGKARFFTVWTTAVATGQRSTSASATGSNVARAAASTTVSVVAPFTG